MKGTVKERRTNEKELSGFKNTWKNGLHSSNSIEAQIWE
jgi:hypothetical protein